MQFVWFSIKTLNAQRIFRWQNTFHRNKDDLHEGGLETLAYTLIPIELLRKEVIMSMKEI